MDKKLNMRLDEEDQKDLDNLRRSEADLPSRSEMIRRLIKRATLEAVFEYNIG